MHSAGISKLTKMSTIWLLLSTVANRYVRFCIALTFLFRSRLLAHHHWSVTYTPFMQTLVKLHLSHYPQDHSNSQETEQQFVVNSGTKRESEKSREHLKSLKMPKCKFTDELQIKFQCFHLGQDPWEAERITCKAGMYVSVSNKGARDLEAHIISTKHKTPVKGESSSCKLTDYFVRSGKTEDTCKDFHAYLISN